jgi:transposase
MESMNAYSEDLRKKIVEALPRGTSKSEGARFFGVSLSSVERYARMAEEGRPLAPKKRPGSRPKIDEGARRLLESDLEERPAATLPQRRQYLQKVAGVKVSESTVRRMLKRMGWSRKKIGGCERARRVLEGDLENVGRRRSRDRRGAAGFRRRDGHEHSLAPLYGWSRRGRRAHLKAPRNWGSNLTLLASITREGMDPCLAVEGATTKTVFEAYLEHVLAPSLRPGQVVGDGQPFGAQGWEGARDCLVRPTRSTKSAIPP